MNVSGIPAEEINACAELVRKGDPDRFRTVMAAPPHHRAVLFPLLALNLEIARAPYMTAEPMIAEIRLQWWRDAVAEAFAGKPARAHEVAAPLTRIIVAGAVHEADFTALIDARRWDIGAEPFEDDAALDAHLEATGGALLRLAVRAGGGAADAAATDAGYAMALANWFVAIPGLEAMGKRPLVDGRFDAVAALADAALARLAKARRAHVDPALAPIFRLTSLAGPVLNAVARSPRIVAAGEADLPEFRKRARILRLALLGGW